VLIDTRPAVPVVLDWHSAPWGVVSLTESAGGGEGAEGLAAAYARMRALVAESFAGFASRLPRNIERPRLLGTSGTVTTLASVHLGLSHYDRSAVDGQYSAQLPSIVGPTLVAAAYAMSDVYDSVPPLSWHRRGRRSDGHEFTVESLARYQLHDVVHHLHDVRYAARAATVRAYDASAADYGVRTQDMPPSMQAAAGRFAGLVGPRGRVLEIGSGSGRDARVLEEAGLSVRRTDITPAFVHLLRDSGYDADVVDPLVDDLSDPAAPGTPYAGVWADASLLHVDRDDLPRVLSRLADATATGGALFLGVKEGDGEDWSLQSPDEPLPQAVASGVEPFMVVGAIAGG